MIGPAAKAQRASVPLLFAAASFAVVESGEGDGDLVDIVAVSFC